MRRFATTLVLAATLASVTPAMAALSDADKAEVEKLVEELLTKKKPEIIVSGLTTYQQKKEVEEANAQKDGIIKSADKIFNDPTSPVGNNPKGDVNVVEFFDYQCGYCKRAHATVNEVMASDKNIRFIYKQLPVLGEASVVAAKAAVAADKQGKFEAMHEALLDHRGGFDEATVAEIAKKIGADPEKLKADMKDKSVTDKVNADRDLGLVLGARGTPFFIIGTKPIPGAIGLDEFKKAIAEARDGQKAAKKN